MKAIVWFSMIGLPSCFRSLAWSSAYRLAQVRDIFGPSLDDPRARFELSLALRARFSGVLPAGNNRWMEHEKRAEREADRMEREADRMEEESERVGEDIEDAREEWEAKEKDPSVPGAQPDPGEEEEPGP